MICVSIVASFEPRAIFRPQELLCSSGAFGAVAAAFVEETSGLELRISRYSAGMVRLQHPLVQQLDRMTLTLLLLPQDLLPADHSVSLSLIDTCLRIFEAVAGAAGEAAIEVLTTQAATLAPALSRTLLASFLLVMHPPTPQVGQRAIDCLLSTLKLLGDLTTAGAGEEWAGVLGKDEVLVGTLVRLVVATRREEVKAGRSKFVVEGASRSASEPPTSEGEEVGGEGGRVNHTFDVLCLVLGVMTSLVEGEAEVERIVRETSKT